jgi:hypothetical protein
MSRLFPAETDPTDKIFGVLPQPLVSGSAVVVDARGEATLTIITGAGCTATISRVDTDAAVANTTVGDFTVAASTLSQTPVDWAYYRISAAGGDLRYCLV